MNIDLLCKLLIVASLFCASALLRPDFKNNPRWIHWRTTAAGLFIIGVSALFELFCLVHLGHFEDEISWVFTLITGIGFLIAADGK